MREFTARRSFLFLAISCAVLIVLVVTLDRQSAQGVLGWTNRPLSVSSVRLKENFSRKPVWEQNFALQKDGAIDSGVWRHELNPAVPGWNNEQQAYADRLQNVRIDNGRLVIEAHEDQYRYPSDPQSQQFAYTSGRIDTRDTPNGLRFTHGKIEVEMKMPHGEGTWPAAWLLSANQPFTNDIVARETTAMYGSTKAAKVESLWQLDRFHLHDGEPDIVEFYGTTPGKVYGTAHFFNGRSTGEVTAPDASEGFHTYAMEVTPDSIVWKVDGRTYHTYKKPSNNPDDWPFTADNSWYLILNLAMGGSHVGVINDAHAPWKLEVKSVRFYDYIP